MDEGPFPPHHVIATQVHTDEAHAYDAESDEWCLASEVVPVCEQRDELANQVAHLEECLETQRKLAVEQSRAIIMHMNEKRELSNKLMEELK